MHEIEDQITPPYILDGIRATMGVITLDPASSAIANRLVAAERYFDREADGLFHDWGTPEEPSRVWLSPPNGTLVAVRKAYTSNGAIVPPDDVATLDYKERAADTFGTRSLASAWYAKLIRELERRHVIDAAFLLPSLDLLATSQAMSCYPMAGLPACFFKSKVKLLSWQAGTASYTPKPARDHGALLYCGDHVGAFAEAFKPLGVVR
jgi:hypothetical protein